MGNDANMHASNLTTPTRLTGAEIVWATLVGEGVTDVFGYPGGAILPVYDALRKFPIHHILVRHEQGAAHMADGYARASGKVGVAIATSGPGATNLVTGIATAMLDSIPIVCITGNVSSKVLGTDAFQEVDITGITLPVTKHNFLVNRAEDIAPAIRYAFQIAQSGRPGPVLVDITKDAQQATAIFDFAAAKPRPYRPHPMLHVEEHGSGSRRRADSQRQASSDSGRPRRHGIRRDGASAHAGRARADSRGSHAAGPGRLSCLASAQPGHDGHARRSVGEPRHSGSGSADRLRHALRRSRHRHDSQPTPPRRRRFTSRSTPPEINKNIKVDVALVGDLREVLEELLPRIAAAATARHGSRQSKPAKALWPCATSRTCLTPATSTPRTSCTTCGASPAATPLS